jgi:hypothetical protein
LYTFSKLYLIQGITLSEKEFKYTKNYESGR